MYHHLAIDTEIEDMGLTKLGNYLFRFVSNLFLLLMILSVEFLLRSDLLKPVNYRLAIIQAA